MKDLNLMLSRCRELLESNDEIKNKDALFQCYKNRLTYKCGYDPVTEEKLDIIHNHCYEDLAPPWWVDLLD